MDPVTELPFLLALNKDFTHPAWLFQGLTISCAESVVETQGIVCLSLLTLPSSADGHKAGISTLRTALFVSHFSAPGAPWPLPPLHDLCTQSPHLFCSHFLPNLDALTKPNPTHPRGSFQKALLPGSLL